MVIMLCKTRFYMDIYKYNKPDIKNQSKNNWLSNRLFFCLQSIDRQKKVMYYQFKVTGYLTGYKIEKENGGKWSEHFSEKENVTCQANGKG